MDVVISVYSSSLYVLTVLFEPLWCW